MKYNPVAIWTVFGLIASVTAVNYPHAESFSELNIPNPNRYIIRADGPISADYLPNTFGRGKYAVIEFEDSAQANDFKISKGIEMWLDAPVYPLHEEDKDKATEESVLQMTQSVPYGINTVFYDVVSGTSILPQATDLPSVTKEVCIIDSGYQLSHPDLVNTATAADPSQVSTGSPLYYGTDGCEHGTHVAGTIVASDNTVGVVGVFPGASTKIVRTFSNSCGWAYTSELLDAVDRCVDAGADIITMSLGSSYNFPGLCDGIEDYVLNENKLIIAAAGNGAGTSPFYPASCGETTSVAATDSSDVVASFSQHNVGVDIAAPGVGVLSTTGTSGYSSYSGTSMSAPHVAGVAMLLWNMRKTCTNLEIRQALYDSALDKGTPGRDDYYGHGIVNYYGALEELACGVPPTPVPTRRPTRRPLSEFPISRFPLISARPVTRFPLVAPATRFPLISAPSIIAPAIVAPAIVNPESENGGANKWFLNVFGNE